MVSETGPGRSGQADNSGGGGSGFSVGALVSSFAGALGALLVAGATMSLWWPQPVVMANATDTAGVTRDVQVPTDGIEEFIQISATPVSVTLTFEGAGTYRIELRALDGASDPVLNLFAAGSDTVTATNDDVAGSLDSILPVRVAEASDTWRVELTSFGESSGPSVLRILPAADDETIGVTITTGPGSFPSGDITVLSAGEPVEAMVDEEGVWYRFQPASSGVHVLSIRAANDDFDTIAALVPVFAGSEAPFPGTDVTTMRSTFSSDDEDGLNPRFVRYFQAEADYYLFVRSFTGDATGSIAISLELVGDGGHALQESAMDGEHMHDDHMGDEHTDPSDQSGNRSGGGKLNAH